MKQHPITRRRASSSAFHEYVRGVFAETTFRSYAVRTSRARWLRGLAGGARHKLAAKPTGR